jgi:hypothetical protein
MGETGMRKVLLSTAAMGVVGTMGAVNAIGGLGAMCCLMRSLRRRLFFL